MRSRPCAPMAAAAHPRGARRAAIHAAPHPLPGDPARARHARRGRRCCSAVGLAGAPARCGPRWPRDARRSSSLGAAFGFAWWQWVDVAGPRPLHADRPRGGRRRLQRRSSPSWSRPPWSLDRAGGRRLPAPRRASTGPSSTCLALVSASGAMLMAAGQRPDRRLPRPRDPLDRALRAGRLQPPPGGLGRGGPQVLPPRRLLLGHLRLRHRPHLRRHRHAPTWPRSPTSCRRTWSSHNGVLLAGLALLLVGFAFKVAAVPFHMWTPDVYQGSPSPVTGFMAAVAKVGGVRRAAARLRLVLRRAAGRLAPDRLRHRRRSRCSSGAGLAVVQRDVKRMLAYSSINHAGFVLLGLQAADARRASAPRSTTCSPTPSW